MKSTSTSQQKKTWVCKCDLLLFLFFHSLSFSLSLYPSRFYLCSKKITNEHVKHIVMVVKQTDDWKIKYTNPKIQLRESMQSQLDSDRASLRTNLISTDRPDSSQVEYVDYKIEEFIQWNYLVGRSSCLYHTETCLERSTESRGKWSDGTGGIQWFCSVSLFEWIDRETHRIVYVFKCTTEYDYSRSSSTDCQCLWTRWRFSQGICLSTKCWSMFNQSIVQLSNRIINNSRCWNLF